MRSLYEIDASLLEAMAEAEYQAENNDGEITDGLALLLDSLEGEREIKIGNICRYIKSLNGEAGMIKAEEACLSKRRQQAEGKAESLKKYLASYMTAGEKFSDENSKVSWRKSSSVSVDDSLTFDKAPENWVRTSQAWNLTEIKNDIQTGSVTGAKMVENQTIQIK